MRSDFGERILKNVVQEADRQGLFLFKFSDSDIFDFGKEVPKACQSKDARVFVTYTCEQTDDVLTEKHSMTAVISCLGVLLVLIYMTVLHYFKRHSDLN